ncbi:MAG: periplasmic heavy metal sensor [Bryobacteraceae bacterium]|nr:periplasmic heavy metal sensor [Bryobacteraceae bacterium]
MSVTLLVAAAALPVLADPGFPGGGPRGPDFLAGYLGLSDAQKEQAKAIFEAADAAAETPRGELQSAREALTAAVKAGQPDAALDQLSAAVGVIEGQLTAIRAKATAKFYALLTAEQKQKYDQLGERGGPDGRGGFGRR